MYKNKYIDLILLMLIYTIDIVLYFVTFSWIVLLEKNKCHCSNNWKRNFIKYYIIFIVIVLLAFLFHQLLLKFNYIQYEYSFIFDMIKYFVLISELIFVCIVFIYIKDLINNKCECSEMPQRDITLLYSIVDIVIFFSSLVFAFALLLYRVLMK